MTLKKICDMVLEIEEGLMYGTIAFEYDNLMCAMKSGHPMEILDEMLATIFWDVQSGTEPSRENIEKTLELFKDFKRAFKVKEMKKPIDALEEYLFPRKVFSFPIYIEESGESFVEYAVTEKELTKIKKAIENGYGFEEAPGLKGLYGKIMRAAKRQIKEDANLTFEDIDYNELEYCIDYPDFGEDE